MTNSIEHILRLIPENDVTTDTAGGEIDATSLLAWVATIQHIGNGNLNLALVHVLLRTVETFLLADNALLNIARYPHAYLGRADQVIRSRVEELFGVAPPESLVSHLRKCLTGHMARVGQKAVITARQVSELFRHVAATHPRRELRCSVCGYHFQANDVGSTRRDLADAAELVFAPDYDPGRLNDEMKPQDYSRLEIDHIVPEEGLGWDGLDNLQIACQFCNNGRLIFRRPLEPVSTMMAGALSAFPPSRTHRMTRQVIVVAALRGAGFQCSKCEATTHDRELTAQLRDNGSPSRLWCVPWNLEVTCYRC